MSQMSEQSRSVANDLLRLEMQLAMVGKEKGKETNSGGGGGGGSPSTADHGPTSASGGGGGVAGGSVSGDRSSSSGRAGASRSHRNRSGGSSQHITSSSGIAKRVKVTVVAPPGKLGIILANKTDSRGTVVSGVRTSSVLADSVHPGDRIVAIDGEDVSRMTVSEITTIMARKSEFERVLTVLTAPHRQQQQGPSSTSRGAGGGTDMGAMAPTAGGDHGSGAGSSSSQQQYQNALALSSSVRR